MADDTRTWELHGFRITPDTILDTAYAAELAGIGVGRLGDLARAGEIPSVREPAGRAYRAGDVIAWREAMDAREAASRAARRGKRS